MSTQPDDDVGMDLCGESRLFGNFDIDEMDGEPLPAPAKAADKSRTSNDPVAVAAAAGAVVAEPCNEAAKLPIRCAAAHSSLSCSRGASSSMRCTIASSSADADAPSSFIGLTPAELVPCSDSPSRMRDVRPPVGPVQETARSAQHSHHGLPRRDIRSANS